jgi:hypothetical protein
MAWERTTDNKMSALVSNGWIEYLERMTAQRLPEHLRNYLSYMEGKTLASSTTDGVTK